MVGQRWLITNIRIFGLQSFLLAAIAGTIAWFNHANHIYIAALLMLVLKAFVLPVVLEWLAGRVGVR
jgi:hydrogenase-4 component E